MGERAGRAGPWVWIGVLVLTGAFQFFRGAPIDGGVFALAALALTLETLGALRQGAVTRAYGRRTLWWGAGAAGLLLITVPGGPGASVVILLVGLAVLPVAWPPLGARDGSPPSRRAIRRTAVAWAVVAVLVCLWEVGAYFLALPSPAADRAHPTISVLVEPLVAFPVGHTIAIVLWLAGGIALIRLGRAAPSETARRPRAPSVPRAPSTGGPHT